MMPTFSFFMRRCWERQSPAPRVVSGRTGKNIECHIEIRRVTGQWSTYKEVEKCVILAEIVSVQ